MTTFTLTPLIDRPAREGLARAQSGSFALLAPAIFGLALAFLTTTAGLFLGGKPTLVEPVARALLEALSLAVPVFVVISTLTIPKLSPASTFSILSVSVGVAGLSAALVLPLLAFLRLCTEGQVGHSSLAIAAQLMQVLMAPTMFLIAVPVVLSRALSAFSANGERLAWLFGILSFAVFVMRVSPFLNRS